MKRPFPASRRDTITRRNLRDFYRQWTGKTSPTLAQVAEAFCGVGPQGHHYAEPRHLYRIAKLSNDAPV